MSFTLLRTPDHADDAADDKSDTRDFNDDAVSCAFSIIPGTIPDFTIFDFADNPLFTVVSLLGFVRFVNLNSGRDINV
jgi:hypothetical protein